MRQVFLIKKTMAGRISYAMTDLFYSEFGLEREAHQFDSEKSAYEVMRKMRRHYQGVFEKIEVVKKCSTMN